jgi:hypothetical protein
MRACVLTLPLHDSAIADGLSCIIERPATLCLGVHVLKVGVRHAACYCAHNRGRGGRAASLEGGDTGWGTPLRLKGLSGAASHVLGP